MQTLLEEIDFLRRAHDQEIKDLQAIAARDTTSENREFFRNELANAIRDIRAEYDAVSILFEFQKDEGKSSSKRVTSTCVILMACYDDKSTSE